jgi:ABC-type nitrate/sulfonate/bicarbonate transport system substrate-binding protein
MPSPMSPLRKRLIIAGSILFLVLAAILIFLINPPQESKPIRIGYLPIYVDLPLFVAKERGFFEQRGVKVDLRRFAASPEIGTALVSNDVQVGASVAYSVILSTESRDPGAIKIFIVDSETPENYLSSFVVSKGSSIKVIEDLRGKKLGIFPGPTSRTFCEMVLEKHGLDPKGDLEIVEIDVASHISALESGTVNALFTYEPTGTQAVIEKGAIKILPGAVEREIMSPWQAGVWVISSKFAKTGPAQARAVMLALYDAIDYIRLNPVEAKGYLSKYTSIKENVALATPNIPFAKLTEVDLVALQKQTDILHARRIISKPINAENLLSPREWIMEPH